MDAKGATADLRKRLLQAAASSGATAAAISRHPHVSTALPATATRKQSPAKSLISTKGSRFPAKTVVVGAHSSKLMVSCSHPFSQSKSVPYIWMIRCTGLAPRAVRPSMSARTKLSAASRRKSRATLSSAIRRPPRKSLCTSAHLHICAWAVAESVVSGTGTQGGCLSTTTRRCSRRKLQIMPRFISWSQPPQRLHHSHLRHQQVLLLAAVLMAPTAGRWAFLCPVVRHCCGKTAVT